MSARSPISPSKFALIEDLDDLKEFYKLMKSGNFHGEIKCLHVPNGRIKTITGAKFAGPINEPNIDRIKYVWIKYTENDKIKKIKITVPEKKNEKFINKFFYEKNKNGGSRKTRKTRKTNKQNKINKRTNRSKTVKKY